MLDPYVVKLGTIRGHLWLKDLLSLTGLSSILSGQGLRQEKIIKATGMNSFAHLEKCILPSYI